MKKIFLLFFAVISLNAMENDDENNNNNNNDDNNTELVQKNTDYYTHASYFEIHEHTQVKRIIGGRKWKNCWKFRTEKEKINAPQCHEFENKVLEQQIAVVFYNRENNEVQGWQNYKTKKGKIPELARQKLDPKARPEAAWGIFLDYGMPKIVLYDRQYSFLGEATMPLAEYTFSNNNPSITPQEKEELAKLVDISALSIFYSNSAQGKDVLQKVKESERVKKALKKEKK